MCFYLRGWCTDPNETCPPPPRTWDLDLNTMQTNRKHCRLCPDTVVNGIVCQWKAPNGDNALDFKMSAGSIHVTRAKLLKTSGFWDADVHIIGPLPEKANFILVKKTKKQAKLCGKLLINWWRYSQLSEHGTVRAHRGIAPKFHTLSADHPRTCPGDLWSFL